MAIPIPENLRILDLQTDLLEQEKAYSLLLHDMETAGTEGNLLREDVYSSYKGKDYLCQSTCFPAAPSCSLPPLPILHSEISYCSVAESTFAIDALLGNLKQAYGAYQIREQGNKLVSHLRDRATERKRAFMAAEEEKKCALIELETAESQMKDRVIKFTKEMEDLSQENESITEELDTMKVVYSLRKGMSCESEIRNSYEKQLTSLEDVLNERESQVSELHCETIRLSEGLNKTETERNKMLEKYHKLEDRYKREIGGNIISRTSSFAQPIPTRNVKIDAYSHERSSSVSSKTSQRSLPHLNN